MLPLISVIMPVYNVEKYIETALKSIVNQTYKNLEIIIVDDGSTDKSIQIIKDKFKDKRIKLINQKNQGLSMARNTGIDNAIGEFIFFVDSDDYVEPELIYNAVLALVESNSEFISFTHDYVDETGNKANSFFINDRIYSSTKEIESNELISLILEGKARTAAWSYIIKTKIIKKANIRFPAGRLYEDNDTTLQLINESKKCMVLKKSNTNIYHYRKRENSITNTKSTKRVDDLIIATNSAIKVAREIGVNEKSIQIYHVSQLLSSIKMILKNPEEKDRVKFLKKSLMKIDTIGICFSSIKLLIKHMYTFL